MATLPTLLTAKLDEALTAKADAEAALAAKQSAQQAADQANADLAAKSDVYANCVNVLAGKLNEVKSLEDQFFVAGGTLPEASSTPAPLATGKKSRPAA